MKLIALNTFLAGRKIYIYISIYSTIITATISNRVSNMTDEPQTIKKKYKKVKPHLPPAEDTTKTKAITERLAPGLIRHVGELIFGERWQVPLARALSEVRGKPVSPTRIHQWMTAVRPIQSWVYEALGEIAIAQGKIMAAKAKESWELGLRLSDPALADRAYLAQQLEQEAEGLDLWATFAPQSRGK